MERGYKIGQAVAEIWASFIHCAVKPAHSWAGYKALGCGTQPKYIPDNKLKITAAQYIDE